MVGAGRPRWEWPRLPERDLQSAVQQSDDRQHRVQQSRQQQRKQRSLFRKRQHREKSVCERQSELSGRPTEPRHHDAPPISPNISCRKPCDHEWFSEREAVQVLRHHPAQPLQRDAISARQHQPQEARLRLGRTHGQSTTPTRIFFAIRARRVITRVVNVTPTFAVPGADLTARLTFILEGLIEDIAVASAKRWGFAPLVLWLIRPYLRGIIKDFGVVVAQAQLAAMIHPRPAQPDPIPPSQPQPPETPCVETRGFRRPGLHRSPPAQEPRSTPADGTPGLEPRDWMEEPRLTRIFGPPRAGRRFPPRRVVEDRRPAHIDLPWPAAWKPAPSHARNVTVS